MKYYIFLILCLILILPFCKKDDMMEIPNGQEVGFISGIFGSDSLHYIYPFYHNGQPNINSNASYSIGQITIIRNDALNPTKSIMMNFSYTGIDSVPLNKNLIYAELALSDLKCQIDTVNGSKDSCNYLGFCYDQSFEIRITDKKDDILTGEFFGVIKTNTGLSQEVTDGKFRIKIIRTQ